MQECFTAMKECLGKATLALLFLCILSLTAAIVPIAKAETLSLTLNPSQGPPGTTVLTVIAGFRAPTTLSVTFGTTNVRTIKASMYSTLSMDLLVPEVSPGTYTVTVTSTTGGVATNTFTVTQGSFPTPSPEETPTETPEETPNWVGPTSSPVIEDAGFGSPLTIGLVAAAIAAAGFTTFLYVRRVKQEPLSVQDTTEHKPRPPIQEPSAYKHESSVQQTPPYSYGSSAPSSMKSARSIQTATKTKVCKHCRQNVRDDLNVCPYCFKRLR